MIFDLNRDAVPDRQIADVLVIGGGTCGLVLADALRQCGLTVTVVESGGLSHDIRGDEFNAAEQSARHYRGAAEGRRRGLGGTSLIWGGAMLPFLPHDVATRSHLSLPRWPLQYEELATHIPELERLFRIAHGPYDSSYLNPRTAAVDGIEDDEIFFARFAKWPSFSRRNTAQLFAHRLRRDPRLHVYLNATVRTLHAAGPAPFSITGADIVNGGGVSIAVRARHVVLCAGAIECTRLLLVAAQGSLSGILSGNPWLGRGLYDHISMHVAEARPIDRLLLNRMAGFRFQTATMRSFRLELTAAAQMQHTLPSAWAHIGFDSTQPTAFDAMRLIMRRVQQGLLPDRSSLAQIAADPLYLIQLGAWRVFRRQLRWPRHARYLVTVVGEQLPRKSNFIELSSRVDRLGQPLPRIHWDVDLQDMDTIRHTTILLREYWRTHCEARIGALHWLIDPDRPLNPDTANFSDVYHPGGTTRMGVNRDEAVVDGQLQVFGTRNLHVLSTSVFPSGASANPTMSLLLLGLRLAKHLQMKSKAGA
jgi:choline dehydrogenase-like flavoprotein